MMDNKNSSNCSSAESAVILRAPEPSDLDAMYLWENDPSAWRVGWNYAPLSRKQISDYISEYGNLDPMVFGQIRMMICVDDGKCPVGMVDLTDIDMRNRRAQVGIFVADQFRNLGYAGVALEKISAYSFEFLGLHQLWAMTANDNEIARSLFTASGYKTCGRLKSWLRRGRSFVDVIVFQKMLI